MPIQTTFKNWMASVDAALDAKCGLSSSDLADCPFHDWFDDEVTPAEAAQMTLEYNDFPF